MKMPPPIPVEDELSDNVIRCAPNKVWEETYEALKERTLTETDEVTESTYFVSNL